MGLHQRNQPELREVFRWKCVAQVLRPGIPPWTMTIDAGFPCPLGVEPEREHFGFPCLCPFPLPPHQGAQPSAYPHIQCFNRLEALGQAEVVHPSPENRVELLDGLRQ